MIVYYLTMMILIISLSNVTSFYIDNHFEMTGENASSFLHTFNGNHHTSDFSKREMGRNCIPCKFGINPCCEPNICVKKTFWPDECMEIKRAGPTTRPHFN